MKRLKSTNSIDNCLWITDPPVIEKTENSREEELYGKYRLFEFSVHLVNVKFTGACYVCAICDSTHGLGCLDTQLLYLIRYKLYHISYRLLA